MCRTLTHQSSLTNLWLRQLRFLFVRCRTCRLVALKLAAKGLDFGIAQFNPLGSSLHAYILDPRWETPGSLSIAEILGVSSTGLGYVLQVPKDAKCGKNPSKTRIRSFACIARARASRPEAVKRQIHGQARRLGQPLRRCGGEVDEGTSTKFMDVHGLLGNTGLAHCFCAVDWFRYSVFMTVMRMEAASETS